ncbi:MAG: glycosyltransferase family 39 protein [Chloroflexi bacterium]|nr:glycosyltransferase family 39 protein [Chloroflexota bacterium]
MMSDAQPAGISMPVQSAPPERPHHLRFDDLAARLTNEWLLWSIVLGVALLARVWRLDGTPLTSAEAASALNALSFIQGTDVRFDNPLFGLLQALTMAIFGASDFSARIPSAVMGAIICLLPASLRNSLGKERALIAGALLAFSPTMWFISRLSGGSMLAWALAFGVWVLWRRGSTRAALACLGLLLACGADAVTPLLVALTSIGVGVFARRERPVLTLKPADLVLSGAIFVLAATGCLWHPAGLGDVFTGLATWWQNLFTPGFLSPLRLLGGFSIYEPFILICAAIAAIYLVVSGQLTNDDMMWLGWAAAGFILLLLTQSRDASNLIPLILGGATFAAAAIIALIRSLIVAGTWHIEGVAIGLCIPMLVYGFLGLSMYASQGQAMWLIGLLLALIMLVGIAIVVILTVDPMAALRSVGTAIGLCLIVYTFGTGYQLTQVRTANPAEAYVSETSTPNLQTLVHTIETTSARAYGDPNTLPLQVLDTAPPALRWALRNQRGVRYVAQLNNSAAALTPINVKPEGDQVYIGNAFRVLAQAQLGNLRCQRASTNEPSSAGQAATGQTAARQAATSEQLDCTALARWFMSRDAGEITVTRWIFWLRQDTALKASGLQ